jgi:uncharacterized protein YrrD
MTMTSDHEFDARPVVARSSSGTVHLVDDTRTHCGQRLTSLDVERGQLKTVTCRTCRKHIPERT